MKQKLGSLRETKLQSVLGYRLTKLCSKKEKKLIFIIWKFSNDIRIFIVS